MNKIDKLFNIIFKSKLLIFSIILYNLVQFRLFSQAPSSNLEIPENIVNYEFLTYDYDELYTKIEFNYYFLNKVIDYNITFSDSISGNVTFRLKFTPKNKELPPVIDTWVYNSKIAKSEFQKEISLFGNRFLGLLPNEYSVNFDLIKSSDSTLLYGYETELKVPNYYEKFGASDLQIAYKIESEKNATQKWPNIFYKNSLFVIPNPVGELNSNNPKLYLYYEIYNTKTTSPEGLTIDYFVLDAAKREVFKYSKDKSAFSNAMVEFIELPLSDLSTGVYYIRVIGRTKSNDKTFEKFKKFYLINPDLPPEINASFSESLSFEESAFPSYDEDKVSEEYDKIAYILTESEKDEYKLLTDVKAKQRALFKFWTLRDPKPETKVNEKMVEYDKRIQFANTYFNQGGLDGWRSERGRTLLKYGFPTQRNIFPQRDNKVAAEEWFYAEIRGGVHFYFVDRLMNNTFILAHSTMINEVFNPYWYSDYNPAMDSDGSDRFRRDDRLQNRR